MNTGFHVQYCKQQLEHESSNSGTESISSQLQHKLISGPACKISQQGKLKALMPDITPVVKTVWKDRANFSSFSALPCEHLLHNIIGKTSGSQKTLEIKELPGLDEVFLQRVGELIFLHHKDCRDFWKSCTMSWRGFGKIVSLTYSQRFSKVKHLITKDLGNRRKLSFSASTLVNYEVVS